MNNEKKILEMLGNIQGDISEMKGDIAELKENVAVLNSDIAEQKVGLKELNARFDTLERIVLRMEHDHGEKLSALFDGFIQLSTKWDEINDDTIELRNDRDSHEIRIGVLESKQEKWMSDHNQNGFS